MLKQIIAYLPAWIFFWIGHFVSCIMDKISDKWPDHELMFDILYPIYSFCMLASCDINDWGGLTIWTSASTEEDNDGC